MSEILDTATGSVAGDVEQIRNALYGREVRASIAEAIELLDSDAKAVNENVANLGNKINEHTKSMQDAVSTVNEIGVYQEYAAVGSSKVPTGKLLMHYADGTTSKEIPIFERHMYNGTGCYIINGIAYAVDDEGYLTPSVSGTGFYVSEAGFPVGGFWLDLRGESTVQTNAETFVYPTGTPRYYYDQNGKVHIPNDGWCSMGCLRYRFDSNGSAELLGFDMADGTLLALETIRQLTERVSVLEEQLAKSQ